MFFANQQSNKSLAKNTKKPNEQSTSSSTNNFRAITFSSYKQQTTNNNQSSFKTISPSKPLLNKANMAKGSHVKNLKELQNKFSFKMPCLKVFFLISHLFLLLNNCSLDVNAEILIQNLDQLNTSLHNIQQYAIGIDKLEEEQLKILKRREEIERIKSETLIDVFKTKILKLLNVEQVPSPTEINIAHNTIPEPILKEYHRLIRVSRMDRNKKFNLRNRFGTEARGSRDLESDENELEHEEVFDEAIRFNGSVVQRIMLLPNKRIFFFEFFIFL